MQREKQLVPKLRFTGFEGVWKKMSLKDICDMKAGKFISASKINDNPEINLNACYGGNGLRGYVNSFTHSGLFSLIGRQGAHCGNIKLVSGQFHATEHAVVVTPKQNVNTVWLNYILGVLKLNQYATGQAQPGISVSNIIKVNLKIPESIHEQQRIANFLTSIDKQIQTLEKKKILVEHYKKGVLQKIFKQELRFKDDDGDDFLNWEKRKFSDVLFEHKLKSTGKEEVHSVSVHKGVINQIEHLGRSFSAKDTSHYSRALPNDIIYTKSPTGDFPLGIIKQNHIREDVIISPLYGVFTPETKELGYILHGYFESPINTSNYLSSIIQKGAKNTINITNTTFLSKKMLLPVSKEEQIKIANFLSAIDKNIVLVNTKIEHTKSYKKGLLQQMFV
jgi:type I restriction enzyme S subunit